MNKNIEFPCLLLASEYAPDAFWSAILMGLARNETPLNVFISKKFLCCSLKGASFSYKINENEDPATICADIIALFQNKLNIRSYNDHIRDMKAAAAHPSVRKKATRDLQVEAFLIRMQKKHRLSWKICRSLLTHINIALVLKALQPRHFVMRDNNIESISVIEFTNGAVVFHPSFLECSDSVVKLCEKRITICDLWNAFIESQKSC